MTTAVRTSNGTPTISSIRSIDTEGSVRRADGGPAASAEEGVGSGVALGADDGAADAAPAELPAIGLLDR